MKIVQHPFHASIVPQPPQQKALWHCVIRREGSAEILARHDASTKEDAYATTLLEIVRLRKISSTPPLRNAS